MSTVSVNPNKTISSPVASSTNSSKASTKPTHHWYSAAVNFFENAAHKIENEVKVVEHAVSHEVEKIYTKATEAFHAAEQEILPEIKQDLSEGLHEFVTDSINTIKNDVTELIKHPEKILEFGSMVLSGNMAGAMSELSAAAVYVFKPIVEDGVKIAEETGKKLLPVMEKGAQDFYNHMMSPEAKIA